MANDLNSVSLVGRLAADPELRSTQSGTSLCNLRVAYNTSKKEGESWVDVGNFISVTVWGAQGEAIARNLTKGQRVGIEGSLEHRTWQAQDGSNRESTQLVARRVQYLTPKGEGSSPSTPSNAPPAGPVDDSDIPFLWDGPTDHHAVKGHASRW